MHIYVVSLTEKQKEFIFFFIQLYGSFIHLKTVYQNRQHITHLTKLEGKSNATSDLFFFADQIQKNNWVPLVVFKKLAPTILFSL